MGIPGLLPFLKAITSEARFEDLAGLTIGIDTYVWLHRGIYGCAADLALELEAMEAEDAEAADDGGGGGSALSSSASPKPPRACNGDAFKYLRYCEERLNALLAYGVKPYFVFDGAPLPAKLATEETRRASRAQARAAAKAALAAGDHGAASTHFARCIDVTPQLAFEFIKVLRRRGIPFVVAPYEADAQLAFLAEHKLVDAVLTEDSDMLPYGVQRVLVKLDTSTRTVQEVRLSALTTSPSPSFLHWTPAMFLDMCILAGCDYLPSPKNMAIKRAHEHVARYGKDATRSLRVLAFKLGDTLPPGYEEGFQRARWTFLHQRVYDPRTRSLVHRTPLPDGLRDAGEAAADGGEDGGAGEGAGAQALDLSFLGAWMPVELARDVCEGRLDPVTKAPYRDWSYPETVARAAAGGAGGGGAGAGSWGGRGGGARASAAAPAPAPLRASPWSAAPGAATVKKGPAAPPAIASAASGAASSSSSTTRLNFNGPASSSSSSSSGSGVAFAPFSLAPAAGPGPSNSSRFFGLAAAGIGSAAPAAPPALPAPPASSSSSPPEALQMSPDLRALQAEADEAAAEHMLQLDGADVLVLGGLPPPQQQQQQQQRPAGPVVEVLAAAGITEEGGGSITSVSANVSVVLAPGNPFAAFAKAPAKEAAPAPVPSLTGSKRPHPGIAAAAAAGGASLASVSPATASSSVPPSLTVPSAFRAFSSPVVSPGLVAVRRPGKVAPVAPPAALSAAASSEGAPTHALAAASSQPSTTTTALRSATLDFSAFRHRAAGVAATPVAPPPSSSQASTQPTAAPPAFAAAARVGGGRSVFSPLPPNTSTAAAAVTGSKGTSVGPFNSLAAFAHKPAAAASDAFNTSADDIEDPDAPGHGHGSGGRQLGGSLEGTGDGGAAAYPQWGREDATREVKRARREEGAVPQLSLMGSLFAPRS